MTLVMLPQPQRRWRSRRRRRKEQRRTESRRGKQEDRWTLTTATFAQVHKLRPPSVPSLTVGEVSAAHTCLNRDAAEPRGRGQDAGRDGGGRRSAGESLPSVTHQHLRVEADWSKPDQRWELTS